MITPWPLSTVDQQFDVVLGKMLDAGRNAGVPKPYLGNRAVQWGRIDIEAAGVVPLTESDLRRFRLRAGDLLVCEGGEVGRAAIWNDELPECYFQKALHRLRPRCGYDVRLMLAFLGYWSLVGGFGNYVTQTSIAHLPREKFVQMPLPLPEKAEQRAIGDLLEDVDGLITSLERLIAKKCDVKQGMMQELLTSRTRLPGFADKWEKSEVRSLAAVIGGGTPSTRTPSYWGGGIPWFTPAEIDSAGSGLVSQSERTITLDGLANSSATLLPAGSVLVTSRASLGNCAVADVPIATNQGFASLVPKDFRSTWFLYYWIQQNTTELESRAAGSTFLEISSGKVSEIPILAPGIDEQEAIGEVLRVADTEIQALERRLESARAVKVGMMQELLTGRTRLPVGEEA